MKKYFLLFFTSFLLVGCFTTYHKFEKTACDKLGNNPQDSITSMLLSIGKPQEWFSVTDKYFKYGKKQMDYSEISKVIVATKGTISGTRYTLIIVMKDRSNIAFATHNFKTAIFVYSTLECLAGIKPKEPIASQSTTDKYDRLAKLKALYDAGAINADEYESEKHKILSEN